MAVNEQHSSGDVVTETLTLAATIAADDDLKEHAGPLLTARKQLKADMRARQDADDEVRLAHGGVIAAEWRTDAHVVAFATKVAARYVQPGKPGEKSAEFQRLFDGKTPASLLRDSRDDRTTDLKGLVARIGAHQTSAEVKRDAADLLKVVARELAAVEQQQSAKTDFAAREVKEDASRLATVVAARSCTKLVQADLSHDLPRARKLLGQQAPGGRRRSKAEEAKKKREEANRLAALAKKAADLAAAAEAEAVQAEKDAAGDAQPSATGTGP